MIFNVAGFPEDEVNVTEKDIEFASEFTDIDLYLSYLWRYTWSDHETDSMVRTSAILK